MGITIILPDGSIQGGGAGTDENVKVSSNDTTADLLENKVVGGANVTVSVLNDGGNEQLEVTATASAGADTASVSANDTTPGRLTDKLVAGTNVTLVENNDGGNETLTVNAIVGSGLSGFFSADTTISQTQTITADHQAVFVGEVSVETGGEIVVESDGELIILDEETYNNVSKIEYLASTLANWTGNLNPDNASDALDELAFRLQSLEDSSAPSTTVYTYWDTDAPPVIAGAIDDEFDDTVVDAAWLAYDFGSRIVSVTEDDTGLIIKASTTVSSEPEWFGRYKALPAGDFTIYTKVMMNNITENGGQAGLALLQDGGSGTGNVEFYGILASVGGFITSRTYTEYNPSTNTQRAFHEWTPRTAYLRVRRSGTTYSFAHSIDGISWVDHPTSFTPSFTPLHIGLIAGNTISVSNWEVRFQFFRYINSNTGAFEPVPGRAITVKN